MIGVVARFFGAVWRLCATPSARLLGCFLAGSIVLAIMTGPPGGSGDPTGGFTGSLPPGRVISFLAFGAAAWWLLLTVRRARSGESRLATARVRQGLVRGGAAWDHLVMSTPTRWALGILSFAAAVVIAVLAADLTGPYASNKVTMHYALHQFSFSFTYGYLMFAILLWGLLARHVLEHHGLRPRRAASATLVRAIAVVVGCLLAGLVFALAANPWLSPRLHWSDVALAARGTSIFWQWPTYLWLLGSLVVARRVLVHGRSVASPATASIRRRLSSSPQLTLVLGLTCLFVAVEWPKFLAPFWQGDITQQIGTYCLLALGLNVVVGFAGLLDLGYVAFYAVGAYTAAYFTGHLPVQPPVTLNIFAVIPIAIAAAMLAGVLLGIPTLRVRGDYLAIVTLGFGEIIEVVLNNWSSVTGGSQGTTGYLPPFSINFLGIHYSWNDKTGQANELAYYYILLAFIALAIFVFVSINRSRVGRRWSAIREDEVAASSIGVNPLKYKVMAFAIGASTAGFAGIFTGANIGVLYPQSFVLENSILILALVIFGGMGSIIGVMVGAALFEFLIQYLQLHPFPGYLQQDYYMYIGVLFIILMIYRPQGLIASRRRAREIELAEHQVGFADPIGAEQQ